MGDEPRRRRRVITEKNQSNLIQSNRSNLEYGYLTPSLHESRSEELNQPERIVDIQKKESEQDTKDQNQKGSLNDMKEENENMRFIESIEKMTDDAIAMNEREEKAALERAFKAISVPKMVDEARQEIDAYIRKLAMKGKNSIRFSYNEFNDRILFNENRSELIFPFNGKLFSNASHKYKVQNSIVTELVHHYLDEGFGASGYYSLDITWSCERMRAKAAEEIAEAERRRKEEIASIKERIDSIQSAKIIGSFISEEGSDGKITNYVMHTIRLTHVDGTREIFSIRESDIFFQGIMDKFEN